MSETLDLIVYSHNPGELTTNAQAILEGVKARLADYTVDRFSGERIQEAKGAKAELNAAAKSLNDKRIEIERAHSVSISDGVAMINQAVAEIKRASLAIDGIVKEVEVKEKAEKESELRGYFDSLGTELVTFAQIFQPEWANKSTSLKAGKTSIAARVEQIKSELETVQAFGDEAVTAFFLKSLSLSGAMKMAGDLKAGRERAAKIEADRLAKASTPMLTVGVDVMQDGIHMQGMRHNFPTGASMSAGQATTAPDSQVNGLPRTVAPQVQQSREAIAKVEEENNVGYTFQPPALPELVEPEILTRTFTVKTNGENLKKLVAVMNDWGIEWVRVGE